MYDNKYESNKIVSELISFNYFRCLHNKTIDSGRQATMQSHATIIRVCRS